MVLIKERIGKMLEYLKDQIYPESVPIGKYRMIKTDQRFADVANLDTSDWEEFTNQDFKDKAEIENCYPSAKDLPEER